MFGLSKVNKQMHTWPGRACLGLHSCVLPHLLTSREVCIIPLHTGLVLLCRLAPPLGAPGDIPFHLPRTQVLSAPAAVGWELTVFSEARVWDRLANGQDLTRAQGLLFSLTFSSSLPSISFGILICIVFYKYLKASSRTSKWRWAQRLISTTWKHRKIVSAQVSWTVTSSG